VGLIGFSNPDTPSLIRRENVRGLVFNPPGAAAKGLHSIFKKDADIFVVLSHLGVDADKKFAKDNSFIHVIIGGLSRTVLSEPLVVKKKDGSLLGPIIGQAGSQGLYLGRLDLMIEGHRDPKTKNAEYSITDHHYQLIPITADLPEDPQMVALLDKYRAAFKAKPLDEMLASVSGNILPGNDGDSLLGQITTDAVRTEAETELAVINSGFFHSDFKSGPITREILYEILPVDDEIVTMEIPGSVVRKAVELSESKRGQGGFLQVSGMKIEKSGGSLNITIGNEPLKDKKKYLLALNDFLAGGGDGYDLFRHWKYRKKTGLMIRGLLEETLRSRQKIVTADLEKRWVLP
jgi:2',3'-cyclic-nucleotide 2'-phosphodiesterase (5'-nucleotidase family)